MTNPPEDRASSVRLPPFALTVPLLMNAIVSLPRLPVPMMVLLLVTVPAPNRMLLPNIVIVPLPEMLALVPFRTRFAVAATVDPMLSVPELISAIGAAAVCTD